MRIESFFALFSALMNISRGVLKLRQDLLCLGVGGRGGSIGGLSRGEEVKSHHLNALDDISLTAN